MKVAVLVPTLGRPHALAPLIEEFRATTPPDCHRIYFVVDRSDAATRAELVGPDTDEDVSVVVCDGTYPVKTNAGYVATDREELILPTADDIVPHPGWYEAALLHFEAGAQVVGTNDLTPSTAKGTHATMPIVRRSYIEDPGAVWGEPGKVFFEGYHHTWVETELWQLAEYRGVAAFEPESIIEHRHPSWGTREPDDTDRKGNQQGFKADRETFKSRRDQWLAS